MAAPYSSVAPYSTCQSVAWFCGSRAPCTVEPFAPPVWTSGATGSPTRISSTNVLDPPLLSVTVSVGKYRPLSVYACVGSGPVASVVPSPSKSQA